PGELAVSLGDSVVAVYKTCSWVRPENGGAAYPATVPVRSWNPPAVGRPVSAPWLNCAAPAR
ncbi:hypothetical protein ACVB8X_42725, partial [Streptomyces sp. NRAIS4]